MTSEKLAEIERRHNERHEITSPAEATATVREAYVQAALDRGKLLAHLRASQTPPQAVTREQLIHCVWGREVEVSGYISKPQEKATLNMSAAEHLADAILALFEKPAPPPTGT
jgi:hypothetical protein